MPTISDGHKPDGLPQAHYYHVESHGANAAVSGHAYTQRVVSRVTVLGSMGGLTPDEQAIWFPFAAAMATLNL
jgi:hypothetical protein